jgi:hypothetical protein
VTALPEGAQIQLRRGEATGARNVSADHKLAVVSSTGSVRWLTTVDHLPSGLRTSPTILVEP